MIGRLRHLFWRKVPRQVERSATVLLLLPTPAAAWGRARRNMRKAEEVGNETEAAHWWAVRREIENRTGYRRGADVATRYTDG